MLTQRSMFLRWQMQSNTAVYLDFDNAYLCIKKQYSKDLADRFIKQLSHFLCRFQGTREYSSKKAYINDNAFSDYIEPLICAGFSITSCRPITLQGKTVADTEITVDMTTAIFTNPNLNEIMIMSDDADFIPALRLAKSKGKKVTIVNFSHATKRYLEYADEVISIEQALEGNKLITMPPKALKSKIHKNVPAQTNHELEIIIQAYMAKGLPLLITDFLMCKIIPEHLLEDISPKELIASLNIAPYVLYKGIIYDPSVYQIISKVVTMKAYSPRLIKHTQPDCIDYLNKLESTHSTHYKHLKAWLLTKVDPERAVKITKLLSKANAPIFLRSLRWLEDPFAKLLWQRLLPSGYTVNSGFIYCPERFYVNENKCLPRVDLLPGALSKLTALPSYPKRVYIHMFNFLAEGVQRFIVCINALSNFVKQRLKMKGANFTMAQVKHVVNLLQNLGHYFSNNDTPDVFTKIIASHCKNQYRAKKLVLTAQEKDQVKQWLRV